MTPEEDLERWQARVGTTLREKWTLERLLGVGGMAAVYAATHKMGRRDAVKILHPEIARSKELRARFEQEARAVTALGHPGVVEVRDIDVAEDGSPFLVMEYLEGEPLSGRIERREVAVGELLAHVDALLEVLEVAHARGIVHRDIKPDNLFVTREGRLKVLDFGIARMREKHGPGGYQTKTGSTLGTVSYMAPEQVLGRAVDGRSDLFAVGATMFRALTGRRIHHAETESELLVKMGTQPAPALLAVEASIDPRVARIVDRALAFDADGRYPDASTMRADVQAVLRGQEPPFAAAGAAPATVAAGPLALAAGGSVGLRQPGSGDAAGGSVGLRQPGSGDAAGGPPSAPRSVVVGADATRASGPSSLPTDPTRASGPSGVPSSPGSAPTPILVVAPPSVPVVAAAAAPLAPPAFAAATPTDERRERRTLLLAVVLGGLALLAGTVALLVGATSAKPKKVRDDADVGVVTGPASSANLGSLLFGGSSGSASAAARPPRPQASAVEPRPPADAAREPPPRAPDPRNDAEPVSDPRLDGVPDEPPRPEPGPPYGGKGPKKGKGRGRR